MIEWIWIDDNSPAPCPGLHNNECKELNRVTGSASQVAGQSCQGCYKRSGKLTHQFAHGPCGRYGEVPRFVFRSYHCQWCLASANRRNKREGKPLWRYLEWSPDSEILSPNAGNERR